jgi:prepilin-type N-terminal cleavage/methylation domain-containing protein
MNCPDRYIENGFTLTELLVALGLTALIATAAAVPVGRWQTERAHAQAVSSVVSRLELAQMESSARVDDSAHGLLFSATDSAQLVSFTGTSYGERNTDRDRSVILPAGVSVAASWVDRTAMFSAGSGAPAAAGTVLVAGPGEHGSTTVTVYPNGSIIW